MSLQTLTCKLCHRIIKEPERIIGEPDSLHQLRIIHKLAQHLQDKSNEESRGSLSPCHPHADAVATIIASVQGFQNWLSGSFFDLTDDLETARDYGRHTINQATRKRAMSDADLDKLAAGLNTSPIGLRNLRDYYEEKGQYAPVVPKQPEVVKL